MKCWDRLVINIKHVATAPFLRQGADVMAKKDQTLYTLVVKASCDKAAVITAKCYRKAAIRCEKNRNDMNAQKKWSENGAAETHRRHIEHIEANGTIETMNISDNRQSSVKIFIHWTAVQPIINLVRCNLDKNFQELKLFDCMLCIYCTNFECNAALLKTKRKAITDMFSTKKYYSNVTFLCHLQCSKKYNKYDMLKAILLSGDIETNPGPTPQTSINVPNMPILLERLQRYNLEPIDVGGDGDCFFRTISHQLYSTAEHHLHIRTQGVLYLQDHPERFIESNTNNSWLGYLTNMSLQGTWADHIIIQSVALALNLRIHVIETAENFNELTIVEGSQVTDNQLRNVYICHIDEVHYVSTKPLVLNHVGNKFGSNNNTEHAKDSEIMKTRKYASINSSIKHSTVDPNKLDASKYDDTDPKYKRRQYMKEYMKKKRMNKTFQKVEYEKQKIAYIQNANTIRMKKKEATAKRKQRKPEEIRKKNRDVCAKRKALHPERIKEINNKAYNMSSSR